MTKRELRERASKHGAPRECEFYDNAGGGVNPMLTTPSKSLKNCFRDRPQYLGTISGCQSKGRSRPTRHGAPEGEMAKFDFATDAQVSRDYATTVTPTASVQIECMKGNEEMMAHQSNTETAVRKRARRRGYLMVKQTDGRFTLADNNNCVVGDFTDATPARIAHFLRQLDFEDREAIRHKAA